jgi:uncharacterized protein YjbI with pentapeptide repeats
LGLPATHNENLEKKSLQGYPLSGIVFWSHDFTGFDFTDSDMKDVSFPLGTDLRGSVFDSTNLRAANLVNANLTDASLVNANLQEADLTGATLSGADLSDSTLAEAILQLTDFRGAKGLSEHAILKAKYYQLAYFDPDMLMRLGLPADHNLHLMTGNLTTCDFKNPDFNFKGAKLIGQKPYRCRLSRRRSGSRQL